VLAVKIEKPKPPVSKWTEW